MLHLSVLVEVIDYTIGTWMVTRFESLRYIDTDTRDLTIGTMANCRLDHCDGHMSEESFVNFVGLADELGVSFKLINYPSDRFSGDATMVRINGHLTGILLNIDTNTVNHVLIHRNQYLESRLYANVVSWINESLSRDLSHYCTRICPDTFVRCDSELVWNAWKFVMAFRPHVFTILKHNELMFLTGQPSGVWDTSINQFANSFVEYKPLNREETNRSESASQMSFVLEGDGRHKCAICDFDSQSTQIVDRDDWQRDWKYGWMYPEIEEP